ncbi:MAG: imidazole glycerol phosphate synthase subunit HisH [Candidatus Omnitrophota bacterium]
MIVVIDYGMGNLRSVSKALEHITNEKIIITDKIKDIECAKKLVFPGVGAFGAAINNLKKLRLIPVIKDQINNNKPFLGLCLGLQVLFEKSQEAKGVKGLGVLHGQVKKFPSNVKIPHIGWNQIAITKMHPLFNGITNTSFFYFCHSYYVAPKDKKLVFARSNYGINFPAVIIKDNLFGIQFHPEKSQALGLKILKNFIEL